MQSQRKWMFLLHTPSGREGMTGFWRVNCETWWCKDRELNTNGKDVRRQKFASSIFVGDHQREPNNGRDLGAIMLDMQQKIRKKIQAQCLRHLLSREDFNWVLEVWMSRWCRYGTEILFGTATVQYDRIVTWSPTEREEGITTIPPYLN